MLKRFIIFTYSGEGLPVAEKLQTEGREVHVVQVQSNRDILTPAEKYKAEDPEER